MNVRQYLLHAGSSPELRTLRRVWVRLRFLANGGRLAAFLGYASRRFLEDDGLRLASGLSYASLLALVPLMAIGLAILAAFPAFEGLETQFIESVFQGVLPQTGEEIARRMHEFVENATQLTGPGIVALAVTALLLLSNINGAFNKIWRASDTRPTIMRLLVYWALLTLGPLLLGSSISLSSYVFATVRLSGMEEFAGGVVALSRVVSIALAAIGFTLIYMVVPNRRIHWGHAASGGLVAALLFELLKYGFGLYLVHFPGYTAIYGAFASIPIFLIWLFLSWCVVLLGAEVAAGLPEWRAAQARGHRRAGPGGTLALALSILGRLHQAMRDGTQLKRGQVIRGLPATPAEVDAVARVLRIGGFIARTQTGRWVLGRDLATATLGELADTLDLTLSAGEGWPPAAEAAVRSLQQAGEPMRATALETLLVPPPDVERAAE